MLLQRSGVGPSFYPATEGHSTPILLVSGSGENFIKYGFEFFERVSTQRNLIDSDDLAIGPDLADGECWCSVYSHLPGAGCNPANGIGILYSSKTVAEFCLVQSECGGTVGKVFW